MRHGLTLILICLGLIACNRREFFLVTVETVSVSATANKITVHAEGYLRNGCERLNHIDIVQNEQSFKIDIYGWIYRSESLCTPLAEPFAKDIPLATGGLEAGTYSVNVNGVSSSFSFEP